MGILGHVTSRANARVAPTTPYAFTDRSVMHADRLELPNGTNGARTASRPPRADRRGPHRPNALRTHDRLASQAPRTHPTAKQLPLMRKTHG